MVKNTYKSSGKVKFLYFFFSLFSSLFLLYIILSLTYRMFNNPMYQHQPRPSSSHFHHHYPPDEYYGSNRYYDDRKRSTQFTKPSNKKRHHYGHCRSKSISKLDTLYDEDVYIRSNTVGPVPANRHYKNENDFYYRNFEQQPHQQNDQFRDGAMKRRSANPLSDNTTAPNTNYCYHNR
jgi:hypothetical protein